MGLGWSRGERLRILAPGWMEDAFGTGTQVELVPGESLQLDSGRVLGSVALTELASA